MLTRDQEIELDVERPAVGGAMIARASGAIVLVEGAIPGERVRARVVRVTKGVAHAVTVAVVTPSPDRRPPTYDIRCAGSLYAHIAYPRQLLTKAAVVADAFARIARAPLPDAVPVRPSPEDGYRMRARLHVKDGAIGFYREGTHALCGIRETRQLRLDTCDALERLVEALRARWGGWDGEVAVSENVDAAERAVHLFVPAPLMARVASVEESAAAATLLAGGGVSGVSASAMAHGATGGLPARGRSGRHRAAPAVDPADFFDPDDDIGAAGQRIAMLVGHPYVTDTVSLAGRALSLRRHVLGFFQGNRFLLAPLVQHVVDQIDGDGETVDLYAGCGLFSVAAAVVRGVPVTAVEGGRLSAMDLAENARRSGAAVRVVHEPVERFVRRRQPTPRTVIVDPPRTGLSADAVEGILHLGPSRVVYVSCDVATLARDARKLLDAGYRIGRVDAFDLFPNTPHVETVIAFSR